LLKTKKLAPLVQLLHAAKVPYLFVLSLFISTEYEILANSNDRPAATDHSR